MTRISVMLVACLVTVVALTSCSRRIRGNHPATAAASARVSYQGNPVEGATVTLHPTAAKGVGAAGITDASGTAQLITFEPGDGAIPGTYSVSVTQFVGQGTPQVTNMQEYAEMMKKMKPGQQSPQARNLLPAKYADPANSGLTANIQESQRNELAFDLTD